eukprot:54464_1
MENKPQSNDHTLCIPPSANKLDSNKNKKPSPKSKQPSSPKPLKKRNKNNNDLKQSDHALPVIVNNLSSSNHSGKRNNQQQIKQTAPTTPPGLTIPMKPFDQILNGNNNTKCNTIYINGLPPSLRNEEDLRSKNWFGRFGEIKNIKFFDEDTFITFNTKMGANKAAKIMNEHCFNGGRRMLKVSVCSNICRYSLQNEVCPNIRFCSWTHIKIKKSKKKQKEYINIEIIQSSTQKK